MREDSPVNGAFGGEAAEAQYWAAGLGTLNASSIPVGAGAGDIGLVGLTV